MKLYLGSGHKIGKPAPLFVKIEQQRLDELKKKYGGVQDSAEIEKAKATEKAPKPAEAAPQVSPTDKVAAIKELEQKITEQGEKVRTLKATGDKTVWQPEVAKLLVLKNELNALNGIALPQPSAGGKKKNKK